MIDSPAFLLSATMAAGLFVAVYFPVLRSMTLALASPYAKADLGRRLGAAIIDGLLIASTALMYQRSGFLAFVFAGVLYGVFRDSVLGRSIGQFCFGLVAIDLLTAQPCGCLASVKRNAIAIVPGANVAAVVLEWVTIARDPQGQRLGDRLAQTQVVEGFGARDLAAALHQWWLNFLAQLEGEPGRRRRAPERV